jgi:hypothetical protein
MLSSWASEFDLDDTITWFFIRQKGQAPFSTLALEGILNKIRINFNITNYSSELIGMTALPITGGRRFLGWRRRDNF